MKRQQDYRKLQGLARYINKLIATGKWKGLAKAKQNALTNALLRLVGRVQKFVARRKLVGSLGAAATLVSANASAQSFADPVLNPFDMMSNTYFAKPEFVDLDGDGDLDFFHMNSDEGAFYFQENTGTAEAPAFGEPVMNPFGVDPETYAFMPIFGDLDGDGDYDMMATSYDEGTFIYFENIGTTTEPDFSDPVSDPFGLLSIYSFPNDFVDIDNDGDLDLFATGYEEGEDAVKLRFYENIGTAESPAFAAGVSDPFGADVDVEDYFTFVDFADLDEDGDMDFMRVEMYGLLIYFHENTGTAEAPEFDSGPGDVSPFDIDPMDEDEEEYLFTPSLVDIDADGDIDLFVSAYYGGTFFFENRQYVAGIEDTDELGENIKLFPNPTQDILNIGVNMVEENINDIRILTLEGREVYRSQKMTNTLSVSSYPAGVYVLILTRESGEISRHKFVKE